MKMVQWNEFHKDVNSKDSLVDFVNGTTTFREFLRESPEVCRSALRYKYHWALTHPNQIGDRTPSEYMQDLVARHLRRKGVKVNKIDRSVRYEIL